MAVASTFRIRATRASPPGRAGEPDRHGTYGAALAQFDELMQAAAANSAAARPLPLFYAVSQAGRAIAAARAAAPWKLRMHGLGAPDLDRPLLSVTVKRNPAGGADSVDSFTGVARATGSEVFAKAADIDTLWASLPEVFDLLPFEKERVVPLLLVPDDLSHAVRAWDRFGGLIVGYDEEPESLAPYLTEHFPTCTDVQALRFRNLPTIPEHDTPYGPGISMWWPPQDTNVSGHLRTLDRVAPGSGEYGPRWIRPGVGDVAMSQLMTWWALLFGLSMVARYEPGGWVSALDYDSSVLAAPLEQLLDTGLEVLPDLVLGALHRPG